MHTNSKLKHRCYGRANQIRGGNSRRRGAIVVITMFSIVALLGFGALAVDYGVMVNDANQLQRGVDAAALGGAMELANGLPVDEAQRNARAEAETVGTANSIIVHDSDVTFNSDSTNITVTSTRTQPLYFARIFGMLTGDITRSSTAAAKGGHVAPQVSPILITQATVDTYAPLGVPLPNLANRAVLNFVDHTSAPLDLNTFGLTDLRSVSNNAKSPAQMARQLDGSDPNLPVAVGDTLDTVNGTSQSSFFVGAMTTRFQIAAGAPWFDLDPAHTSDIANAVGQHYNEVLAGTEPTNGTLPFKQNPRVMDLIVTTPLVPAGGNSNSPVLDFAPVYIESMATANQGVQLTVRFLPKKLDPSGSSQVSLIH